MYYIPVKKFVNPLREEWVKLLSRYRWNWFTTLTFDPRKDLPKTYTAINRAKRFFETIECKEERPIGYYICMELNRLGRTHFHALMGNLEGIQRSVWWKWWFTRYGRAMIEPYNPELGASHYLTKYVVKDEYQHGWFDIQGLHLLKKVGSYVKTVEKQ